MFKVKKGLQFVFKVVLPALIAFSLFASITFVEDKPMVHTLFRIGAWVCTIWVAAIVLYGITNGFKSKKV